VHREVDLVGDQGVTQRGHEYADAQPGDRRGRAVARGHDPNQFDRTSGGGGQRVGDQLRLGECERAATRTEA
jgi:hypothetical protein